MKSVQRCIAMAQLLVEQNFPAIAIHRGMTQEERLSRYDNTWLPFRVAECRCTLLGHNDFGLFCVNVVSEHEYKYKIEF